MAEFNNPFGVAGLMGNLYSESSLSPINLQGTYEKKLGFTDQTYTDAVDNGTYTNFVKDSAGYGLAQWTYWSRKQSLLNFAKSKGTSIGDLNMQLAFLIKELKNYSSVYKTLGKATSVKEASDIVLVKYEKPANQSDESKEKRAKFGQKYYDAYAVSSTPVEEKKEDTTVAINFNKYIYSSGAHYISNSGSDENKAYKGGKAGDQTGHEWELKKWYSRPWTHVFRYTGADSRVPRTLAELGIKAALNDKIGYDQNQRTTYWKQLALVGYDPSAIVTACEEDCSAGVAANVKACGYLLGIKALQNVSSGMSSRNTVAQLKNAGFTVLTDSKYLNSGNYLQSGDILLYVNHHVAMNITKGKNAADVGDGYWSKSNGQAITTPVVQKGPDLSGTGVGKAQALTEMNLRAEANTTSVIYTSIKKGTTIEVLEVLANGWYKVVYKESSNGYAYTSNTTGKYYTYTANPVKETKTSVWSGNPASVKNPQFGATEVPKAKDAAMAGTYKITASKAVNFRKGPGTEYGILYAVPNTVKPVCDGYYTINDLGTKWFYMTAKIKSITVEGFVSEKYVKKV